MKFKNVKLLVAADQPAVNVFWNETGFPFC